VPVDGQELDWSMMKMHDKDHPDVAEGGPRPIQPAGLAIRFVGRIMSMVPERGGTFLVVKLRGGHKRT